MNIESHRTLWFLLASQIICKDLFSFLPKYVSVTPYLFAFLGFYFVSLLGSARNNWKFGITFDPFNSSHTQNLDWGITKMFIIFLSNLVWPRLGSEYNYSGLGNLNSYFAICLLYFWVMRWMLTWKSLIH